jgi:hypothetical protein
MFFRLIDRVQSMIGKFQTIHVGKSSVVTGISVKIAIGPIKNGTPQIPGT